MKKMLLTSIALATVSLAANGSGFWVDAGLSFSGPKSGTLDTLVSEKIYNEHFYDPTSTSLSDSLSRSAFLDTYNPQPDMFPSFTFGYEHSFNKVISASGGVGLRFGSHSLVIEGHTHTQYQGNTMTYQRTGNIEYTTNFSYLVVPVDFKAMIPTRSGGIYFSGGPEFGFLLSAKNLYDYDYTQLVGTGEDVDFSEKTDVKDELSGFNMAMGFRIGGEINVGKHNLLLETGYDFGLTDIVDEESIEAKTGTLTLLGLGFRFNTSKQE